MNSALFAVDIYFPHKKRCKKERKKKRCCVCSPHCSKIFTHSSRVCLRQFDLCMIGFNTSLVFGKTSLFQTSALNLNCDCLYITGMPRKLVQSVVLTLEYFFFKLICAILQFLYSKKKKSIFNFKTFFALVSSNGVVFQTWTPVCHCMIKQVVLHHSPLVEPEVYISDHSN